MRMIMSGKGEKSKMTVAPRISFVSTCLHITFVSAAFTAVSSSSSSSMYQEVETRHLAVEVGTNVIFNCTSNKRAIWTKLILDGQSPRVEYITIGKQLYDVDLAGKFSILHTPRSLHRDSSFDLFLSNASLQDSGKYLCNENLAVFLTVVETPSCTPTKNFHKENLHVVFKCKVRYSGLEGAPTLEWLLDDEVMYPNAQAGIDNVRSSSIDDDTIVKTLEWKPKMEHNRRNVKCVIKHPHLKLPPDRWNGAGADAAASASGRGVVISDGLSQGADPIETAALPFCGFTPLDVRFRPRVYCPHEFFVPQESFDETNVPDVRDHEEDEKADDESKSDLSEKKSDEKTASLVDEKTINDALRRRRRRWMRAQHLRRRFDSWRHHHVSVPHSITRRFASNATVDGQEGVKPEIDDEEVGENGVAVMEEKKPKKDRLMYSCKIYANPLPGKGSMYWERGSDGEKIYVGSKDERQIILHDGREIGGDLLRVGFFVPVEDLSERLPQMRVALNVPLHGTSMMDIVTDVHYVFGPYLSCPPHVYLSNKGSTRGAAADRGGGGLSSKTFLITCRVRIHPPLEEGNVSWSLDGDNLSAVNSYVQSPLSPIAGRRNPMVEKGADDDDDDEEDDEERLTLVMLKLREYQVTNRDAQYMLKLHVQGAHHHATSTLRIQWDKSGAVGGSGVGDSENPRTGASSDRFLENWILNHAGLLVLGGVLLALGLLSGILLLVLYKQGLICSSSDDKRAAQKKKASSKNDKDRLSKAFPEMFHSHRGRRDGQQRGEGQRAHPPGHPHRPGGKSPKPHQPQIGIIAHMPRERSGSNSGSPQTPRHHLLIPGGAAAAATPSSSSGYSSAAADGSRCKTPDSIDGAVNPATMDKMTGLAKLGNALYLKDMDQDGFITIADGRSVLESYNGVYHLGITEPRMAELLRLSSNGNYVNIEVIMRLLITSSQNA